MVSVSSQRECECECCSEPPNDHLFAHLAALFTNYGCGNVCFTYQTPSHFDENQHRFTKYQYAENVGAGIWKKMLSVFFIQFLIFFLGNFFPVGKTKIFHVKTFFKIPVPTFSGIALFYICIDSHRNQMTFDILKLSFPQLALLAVSMDQADTCPIKSTIPRPSI